MTIKGVFLFHMRACTVVAAVDEKLDFAFIGRGQRVRGIALREAAFRRSVHRHRVKAFQTCFQIYPTNAQLFFHELGGHGKSCPVKLVESGEGQPHYVKLFPRLEWIRYHTKFREHSWIGSIAFGSVPG